MEGINHNIVSHSAMAVDSKCKKREGEKEGERGRQQEREESLCSESMMTSRLDMIEYVSFAISPTNKPTLLSHCWRRDDESLRGSLK